MTGGDARRGRRDNGLMAPEYAAAGDVDPRVGEHLLDVLALNGIAAYLRPSTDLNPVTRSSSLPNRPTDRLYVDRLHLSTARDYLARLASDNEPPESPPPTPTPPAPATAPPPAADGAVTDVEDAWAKIVAGFNEEAPTRSWPAAEDVTDAPPPEPLPTRPSRVATPEPEEPSLLDGLDTFGADLPDADTEEGYTPPPPPPVPRPSLPTALGIFGIVGGLVIFLRPEVLPMAESASMLAGFTAVVAGFATLVWRLRPGDDDDDIDPDDGARV